MIPFYLEPGDRKVPDMFLILKNVDISDGLDPDQFHFGHTDPDPLFKIRGSGLVFHDPWIRISFSRSVDPDSYSRSVDPDSLL